MSASRRGTVRGIVVGRAAAGEGSARVLLYTDMLGLITALAKSAREERSKLRAHLQTGTFGVFSLVRGRDVWRVTGAIGTENLFASLSGDTRAAAAAARVLSAVRQFVRGAEPDARLWEVVDGFARSVKGAAPDARELEFLAVWRLLAALGYVRENATTKEFSGASYDPETRARAKRARAALARSINEAISASGL